MNVTQLIAWVTANLAIPAELRNFQIIAVLYGLSPNGGQPQVGARILNHLATLPPGDAALWNPGGAIVLPPPPAPVPGPVPGPAPIPTPLPVVPPPPATPLSIVTASPLTGGTEGILFTEVFQAAGGIPGYTWTEVIGLPAFLTLNANGILSGTPAVADVGNHGFIVRVTDSSGNHVEGNFTLSVAAAAAPVPPVPPAPVLPPVEIDQVTSGLPPVARGEELDEVLTATGGTGAGYRNWQILGPAQAWITLDRRGRLVIEPPDTARLGLVDIDVQVEDGAGNVGTGTLTVDVIEPARTRNVRQFLPIAGIAAGVIAAGLLLFLFLPSVVASAWNHSYWGDSDNGDAQVRTGSNGNGQNGGTKQLALVNGETDTDSNGIPDDTRMDLNMLPGQNGCPSDDAAQQALGGLTVHWISGCLFKWNSNNVDFVQRPCPTGWYCTLDLGAQNVAFKGDGTVRRFEGGSFFPLASKTFKNDCVYLRHENVYAGIVGDPPTLNGNLDCSDSTAISVASTTSKTVPTTSVATTVATTASSACIISSTQDAADKIGGSVTNWAQLDPGVWKYRNKGNYLTGFKSPGGGRLDYWSDHAVSSSTVESISFPQDELTFHCPGS